MGEDGLAYIKLPIWDSIWHVAEWDGVTYLDTRFGTYRVGEDDELELIDIRTGDQVAN